MSASARNRHIDLFRDLRRPAPRGPRFQVVLPALLAAALLAAGAEALQAHRTLAGHRVELERLQRSTETLQQLLAQVAPAAAPQDDTAQVAALETLATQLQDSAAARRDGFVPALTALARARTEGVWLTAVDLDAERKHVTLQGKALDATRVPALLDALARQPTFAGTVFAQLEVKPATDAGNAGAPQGAVQFRVAAQTRESAR